MTFPLPVLPAVEAKRRCRRCGHPVPTGRLYDGMGKACAEMVGLLVRRPQLPVVSSEAAGTDPTLFDQFNEGESMIEVLRKKPLTVETMLWDGTPECAAAIKAWVGNRTTADGKPVDECRFLLPEDITGTWHAAHLYVDHQLAWSPLPVGHRVAKEGDGRGFYPLSPEAVAATYEPVGVGTDAA
ncbi:hypothetical protein K1W54_04765 [Micromonospora sp. CPCC 205371]|nr:hypothetical protein [Micromonospora sp. CPCC 205371]